MKLRVLFPAVAFLSLFMLFGLAGSTFLSLSPVSPVHAQSGAPVFPEDDENGDAVDYTRAVDENTKPYDADKNYVMIGDPITATGSGIIYSIENAKNCPLRHQQLHRTPSRRLSLGLRDNSPPTPSPSSPRTPPAPPSQEVTINVLDVEESGSVALSWTKNSSDQLLFKADVSDPDRGATSTGWAWYESTSYNGDWGEPISGATSDTRTITPSGTAKYLQVTATYTDARGAGKTATATLRRPIKTHSKTLKFDASSSQGYHCLR